MSSSNRLKKNTVHLSPLAQRNVCFPLLTNEALQRIFHDRSLAYLERQEVEEQRMRKTIVSPFTHHMMLPVEPLVLFNRTIEQKTLYS